MTGVDTSVFPDRGLLRAISTFRAFTFKRSSSLFISTSVLVEWKCSVNVDFIFFLSLVIAGNSNGSQLMSRKAGGRHGMVYGYVSPKAIQQCPLVPGKEVLAVLDLGLFRGMCYY